MKTSERVMRNIVETYGKCRAAALVSRMESGESHQKIGDDYGVSRERVRQWKGHLTETTIRRVPEVSSVLGDDEGVSPELQQLVDDIVGTDLGFLSPEEAAAACKGLPGNARDVAQALLASSDAHGQAGNAGKAQACTVLANRVRALIE